MTINPIIIILLFFTITACNGEPCQSEEECYMRYDDFDGSNYLGDRELVEDDFERRARGKESPLGIKPVVNVITRTGPWSGNNQLGATVEYAPDDQHRQTVLRLDEWGMPEIWTVMLGLDIPDDYFNPSLRVDFNVTAIIEPGVGGATQKVKVDWLNGTTVTMPMNALNVIAEFDSSGPDLPDIEKLKLSVTVSRGSQGRNVGPTLTMPYLAAQGVTDNYLRIPDFATHVQLMSTGNTGLYTVGHRLAMHSDPNLAGTVATVFAEDLPDYSSLGVPLPRASRFINYTNTSVAPNIGIVAVFNIGL